MNDDDTPADRPGPADNTDGPGAGPGAHGDPTSRFEPVPTQPGPHAYSQIPPQAPSQTPGGDTRAFTGGEPPVTGGVPSAGGPPPGGQAVVTSPSRRRGRGKLIGLIGLGVVLVVIIALVGSELYFRKQATDCLEQQFSSITGVDTDVSISKQPVLWQQLNHDYPFVQVDTKDGGSDATRLHARGDNITQSGDDVKLGSLHGTGYVPFSRVVQLSKDAAGGAQGGMTGGGTTDGQGGGMTGGLGGLMGGASIESVTGNPNDGTVDVKSSVQVAIFPIPVDTTIRPVVDGGKVRFEVVKASALVFGIPPNFAQQVVDGFTKSMFGPFFDQASVDQLKVTGQGVDFALSGHDVDLSQGTQQQSSGGTCSLS